MLLKNVPLPIFEAAASSNNRWRRRKRGGAWDDFIENIIHGDEHSKRQKTGKTA
jgi:hypothetical protein